MTRSNFTLSVRGRLPSSTSAARQASVDVAIFRIIRMNRYISDADEFYVNVHLNTEMELPNNRDTVLHFFEQMKKGFPELRNFYTRENGDLVLESEKEDESHRWLAIEPRRLCSGHFNPEALDDSFRQHELVLDLAPHLLTISLLDCEALDVMFGFDFNFEGNHDEVVREALGVGHGLEGLFELPRAQVINYEPSITLALNESCQLQCRLADRDTDERLQGPAPRVRRRPDQRLLHGAAILGNGPGHDASSSRCAASVRSARRSSSNR